jgi:hypothetical protein
MTGPLVAVISSGQAIISLWRYARAEGLPTTNRQLQKSYRRLVAAALRRQPHVHVIGASLREVDGRPSVELDATEPIGSGLRRVRSLHVFIHGAELVVEAYAPPVSFDRVNRQVFGPVLRSLVLLRP